MTTLVHRILWLKSRPNETRHSESVYSGIAFFQSRVVSFPLKYNITGVVLQDVHDVHVIRAGALDSPSDAHVGLVLIESKIETRAQP